MKTPLKGFPQRYENEIKPDGSPWWDAFRKAFKMASDGDIVIFYGDRGTGKTRMAYELATDCVFPKSEWTDEFSIRRFRPAIYRTAMEIFMQIRDTFRQESERSELQLMEEFADAALLVIDEIQERGETEFENQKLTAIIDARYRQKRPTILIGNYKTKAEFAATVSPSIVSRTQEGGGAIYFGWESYRTRKP